MILVRSVAGAVSLEDWKRRLRSSYSYTQDIVLTDLPGDMEQVKVAVGVLLIMSKHLHSLWMGLRTLSLDMRMPSGSSAVRLLRGVTAMRAATHSIITAIVVMECHHP
jgi:hypothetical protein